MSSIADKPSKAISKNAPARNEVIKNQAAQEINRLYWEIVSAAETSLEKAIRIGEILSEQKANLKHGEWLPWIENNLPFTRAMASNYIRCFVRRDELNVKGVLHLTDGLRLLAAPAKKAQYSVDDAIKEFATFLEASKGEQPITKDPLPSPEAWSTAKKALTEARAALLKIKEAELWRGNYSSFDEYCTKVLGSDYSEFLLDDDAWAEQEGE